MHSIPCVVGKSSSKTHTKQGRARGLPQAKGWIPGYCARKLQTGEFLLVTYVQAGQGKDSEERCTGCQVLHAIEGKLKFQTVAKKCDVSQKSGDASRYYVTTVILLQAQLQSPSSLEDAAAARILQEAAVWLNSPM